MSADLKKLLPGVEIDDDAVRAAVLGMDGTSRRELAALVIEEEDDSRMDVAGGYPSAWRFVDLNGIDTVVRADLDGGKGYRAPELQIEPVEDFLLDRAEWILDMLERETRAEPGA